MVVRSFASDELNPSEIDALHDLFLAAWGGDPEGFTAEDWEHAFGGRPFLFEQEGEIASHASVVPPNLDLTAGISCEWRPGDVW